MRRTPELARRELLDAAERLYADHTPDEVGLKAIAREAGVSHALVTHYFGTYAGLVEATLERRIRALRERVLTRLAEAKTLALPIELLGLLFESLADPVHLKLIKWMVASEREPSLSTFTGQDQGMRLIAERVARALTPEPSAEMREILELSILTAVSAAYGYALNKHALTAALGRTPSPDFDERVRHTLAGMLQSYVAARLGSTIPAA
jgi:AcrR family transcriptional regulator